MVAHGPAPWAFPLDKRVSRKRPSLKASVLLESRSATACTYKYYQYMKEEIELIG